MFFPQTRKTILVVIFAASIFVLSAFTGQVHAQFFAGSNCCNYYCPSYESQGWTVLPPASSSSCASCDNNVRDEDGNYVCVFSTDTGIREINAIPYPPGLQQLEVWFVRALFAMWAVSGVVFTFALIFIGIQYMTSLGNAVAQAGAIKKLQRWGMGLGLVFLSYPILNTFFNVLPIDPDSCYAQLVEETPGFRFFFPSTCAQDTPGVNVPPQGSGVQR